MRTLKRGGGILNRIKGFFTRKKKATVYGVPQVKNLKIPGLVAMRENYRMPLSFQGVPTKNENIPEPADLWERKEVLINGTPQMVKREPLVSTYNRLFSFFYRKAFGRDTEIPNTITEKEFNELSRRVREISGFEELPDNEEELLKKRAQVALEVFGDIEDDLSTQILNEEVGLNYETQGNKIVDFRGTKYLSEQYGKYFGRYYPYFFAEYKKLLYLMEYDFYQCPGTNPQDNLLNRGSDGHRHQKPISTLKTNLCISLFRDIETVRMELTSTDEVRSNWLILSPDYFPAVQSNPFSKKDMSAKYFLEATFIKDALDNWGIHGIDPLLFELFQKRYPEIAIKMSTYIVNTNDFIYQLKKLKPKENMMIIDKNVFPDEIALSTVYPFEDIEENTYKPFFEKAIKQKKLYGVTPYMAYIIKKKSMPLWINAFGGKNKFITNVYEKLNAYQKITVDFLQYIRFMDVLEDSGYNFVKARKTYEDFLANSNTKEIVDLYIENIVENKKQLLFLQSLVTRQLSPTDSTKMLETSQDILNLLMVFVTNKPTDYGYSFMSFFPKTAAPPPIATMPKSPTIATMSKSPTMATMPKSSSSMSKVFEEKPFVPNRSKTIKNNVRMRRNELQKELDKLAPQLRRERGLTTPGGLKNRKLLQEYAQKKTNLTQRIKKLNEILQSPPLRTMA